MNNTFLENLRRKKPISYLVILSQFLFPVALSLTPAIQTYASTNEKQTVDNERWLAQQASQAGTILSSDNSKNAASQYLLNQANNKVNQEIEHWLNKYGKAQINLGVDKDFTLKNTEAKIIVPLYENENYLLFNQTAFHRSYDRNQGNLGFGIRKFDETQLVGFNTHFDHDFSGNNSRVGFGLEYRRDYFSISSNYYNRLTGWKNSDIVKGYNERPANGWDIRTQSYLPAYPQLGLKANFEQYYGDNVDLFNNTSKLTKDPYAITAGLDYTPFPLLTLNAQHKLGKSGDNDTQIGISLNYQIGTPIKAQLDSSNIKALRLLENSKYDFVDRNNNIVFEYQEQSYLSLKTPDLIEGYSNEQKAINISIESSAGLDYIDLNANDFIANGGKVIQQSQNNYLLYLPYYNSQKGALNTYNIIATAYDKKGKASSPEATKVVVLNDSAIEKATIAASPQKIGIDASSVVTLNITNSAGDPIEIDDANIILKDNTQGVLSDTHYNAKEKAYQANFISTAPGKAIFYAYFNNTLHQDISTTVTVDKQISSYDNLTLKADKNDITLGNSTDLRLTFFDKNNKPIKLDNANIVLINSEKGSISKTTYDDSTQQYIATFTSKDIGDAVFQPSINNEIVNEIKETVKISTFKTVKLTANNQMYVGDTSKLVMKVLDDADNPMAVDNAKIQIVNIDNQTGDGIITETIYNPTDKSYTADFTATNLGKITFYPYIANVPYADSKADTTIISLNDKYKIISLNADPEKILQNETSIITTELQDNQGKPVTDVPVEITLNTAAGTISNTTAVSGKPGYYQATYTGTQPTTALFGVNIHGQQDNDAQTKVVVLGANNLKATLATNKSQLDLNESNHSAQLTLTLTDQEGNPLNNDKALIYQENHTHGSLSITKKISATQYTADFDATNTGTAKFFAALEGIPLTTSVDIAIIDSAPVINLNSATIDADPTHLYGSSAEQNQNTRSANGDWRKANITLDIKDQYGNLFHPDVPIDIVIKNTLNGKVSEVVEVKPGEYQVVYTPTERNRPFTATFYAVIDNVRQKSISTQIIVDPLKHDFVTGGNLIATPTNIEVGDSSELTAIFYNDQNKPFIPKEQVEIRLASASSSLGKISDTTLKDKTYTAIFNSKQIGSADFEVYLDNQRYNDGNTTAQVIITDRYNATLNATPEKIRLNQQSTLNLQIRNHDDKLINAGSDVQIIMKSASGTLSTTTYNDSTKTYSAIFTGKKVGNVEFIPVINGQAHSEIVANVMVEDLFTSANMDREASPITLNKQSDVYLSFKDASGTNINVDNANIILSTPTLGNLTATTWDNTNKRFVATFTGTAMGTATFSATVDNKTIDNINTSIVIKDNPDAFYHPELTPSPSTIKVDNTSEIALSIQDVDGNLTKGNSATIILETPTLGSLSETTWDGENNVYKAIFTSSNVGKARFSATINNKVRQAKTSVQINEAYSLAKLTPNPSTIKIGNTSNLILALSDETGNPVRINNDNVSINLNTPKLGTLGKTTFDTSEKVYKATFNGTTEGTAQFNVSINGTVRNDIHANVIVEKIYDSATLVASPSTIYTGKKSTLTLTFKDASNNPIEVNDANIVLQDADIGQLTNTTYDKTQKAYIATFTGTLSGNAKFNAAINNNIEESINTTVIVKDVSEDDFIYQLTSSPDSIYINDKSILQFTIKDNSGKDVYINDLSIAINANTPYGELGKTTYDKNTGVYSATFTGKNEGIATFYVIAQQQVLNNATASVTVNKVVPITDIAYINSNNYSFALDEGFPKTGYRNVTFNFVMKNDTKASDYTWSSNQSWATVGKNNGEVKLSGKPTSANKTVTITAKPNVEGKGTAFTYTFTLEHWFTFYGGEPMAAPYAWQRCEQNGLDTTPANLLTLGLNKRGVGTVYSEWGKGGAVFQVWSSDTEGSNVAYVNLTNGLIQYAGGFHQFDPVCKTDL